MMSEFDRKVKEELENFFSANTIALTHAEKLEVENRLKGRKRRNKEKFMYVSSILLAMGVLAIFTFMAFERIAPPVDNHNGTGPPPGKSINEEEVPAEDKNGDKGESEKEAEDILIDILKGYSEAVDRVFFSEKDENSKFIHYASLDEVKQEFADYMEEETIIQFLGEYNIYQQDDGLYILGSGYIPMTFEPETPYSLDKEKDGDYTLVQEQNSDFYGHRIMTVKFYKTGDRWVMEPPKEKK